MIKTPEQYKESLRKMRPNIYKFGELIEDVTTHPATKRCVNSHAKAFEAAQDPKYQDLVTVESKLIGEKVMRWLTVMETPEDVIKNCNFKRLMYNLTGTCTGALCVGWNCLQSMWAATYEIDKNEGTDYHQRLKKWLEYAQRNAITVAGALTDPKGDRTLPPSKQKDPDLYLHIVEERDNGIVVRGAKVMIAGVAAANEIFVMPTTSLREEDKDYAVSFVVPRDAEGITIIEARHPDDARELEGDGYELPATGTGITQAWILFNDVFIPKERVFMCGEWKYALKAIIYFTSAYRALIGSCVAGQGDIMAGAAILIARANGLSERTFREQLIKMVVNNETTYGLGVAAATLGEKHPSGAWIPNALLANVNKVHVATLPYETKVLCEEIAGGIGETGCMPSWKDFKNTEYGKLLEKYLTAASPGEARARAAYLIQWLTCGAGIPGCMHGGGSPAAAKLMIRATAKWKQYMEYASKLAGIKKEDIPEPSK